MTGSAADVRELGVAVVGCGDIAGAYGKGLAAAEGLVLRGAWDRNPPRVANFVADHGGCRYESLEELLADDAVDLVVNLTRQTSHAELTARCLRAGRHVYSEKPVAMTAAEAAELAALAEQHGVRLGCAPIGLLGESQQAAWRLVRDGGIGTVRVVYAEVNWGRIERWHPRPQPFYDVGPTFDVGVYPLTLITAMLGPARRVWARGEILLPERRAADGSPFRVASPDFAVIMVELDSGALVRLTTSFYVEHATKQQGMELHGDRGSIALASWFHYDATVEHATDGGPYASVPLPGAPYHGVDYVRGVTELAQAIATDRPHRGGADHAAHVVEIVEAAHIAMRDGATVEVRSTFVPPLLETSGSAAVGVEGDQ